MFERDDNSSNKMPNREIKKRAYSFIHIGWAKQISFVGFYEDPSTFVLKTLSDIKSCNNKYSFISFTRQYLLFSLQQSLMMSLLSVNDISDGSCCLCICLTCMKFLLIESINTRRNKLKLTIYVIFYKHDRINFLDFVPF